MHNPKEIYWQKEKRIFCRSDRVDRAKPNCALTTRQLVHQALTNDMSITNHQGLSEPYTLDNPNPLRVPTCDLIDFQNYYENCVESYNNAVKEHNALNAQLSAMENMKPPQSPAVQSTQQ